MPPKKKKLSREEVLQKKRDAERQRYQQRKNDPQKREEMKERERLKYQKKEKGLRKLAKDMTPREHRAALKKWKEHCTVYRAKKVRLNSITNTYIRENTPLSDSGHRSPASRNLTPVPIDFPPVPSPAVSCVSAPVLRDHTLLPTDSPRVPSPAVSNVNAQRRKRQRQAKKQREKLIKEKNEKIASLQKKIEKYRKRLERLEDRNKKRIEDTPNTKMQKMLDEPDSRKEVVKKALFGDVLNKQLKENYTNLKCTKDKQIFTKVVSGPLVKKYRHFIPKDCAALYRGANKSKACTSLDVPVKRRLKIPKNVEQVIQNFYEDDSNSRIGAGKKEFITRKTVKKQRRYLLDTILNLYKKFVADNFKISYQTFCRLRPFWVVKPNIQNRDTCLCIVHSNLDLKLCALYEAKIIPYNNHQKLLEDLCCDRYNVDCLSRNCLICTNKTPAYKEFDDRKAIKYKMWIAERQEIHDLKTKKPRTVTKYLKKSFDVHPRQLIGQLHEDLEKFFAHQRNIVHQFNAMKDLKQNLQDEDVLIHMDFSENYCTKYAEEIQSFHFGGSRAQLSLHTVVVYLKNSKRSYCTVSENITHSPGAIWVHLQPIFKALPPGIKRAHFLSDGPVTQYRNKTMFFILASKLSEEIPTVEQFTWNYTESGHGKGAPDGVGATCKRTADFVVNAGGDINNIEQFVQSIQERCPGITCSTIDGQDIQLMINKLEKEASKLKSFKGTLNVHQVTGVFSNTILGLPSKCTTLTMRTLSCFCNSEICEHFKIGNINYDLRPRLRVEDVFTDSEPEDDLNCIEATSNTLTTTTDVVVAGTSGNQQSCYNTGDYVLVRFPTKNVEYRYAAVINDVDEEENELRVTFLKICDDKTQTFKIDDSDISDVSFEKIMKKLKNPDLILKGKRIFYKFPDLVDVFEK